MATNALNKAIQNLRRAAIRHDGADLTDAELLDRYIARQDEAAFTVLVRRHGPMVLGVCRRILRNEADAEDAFQATFLVLVRKATNVRPRGMVSNWLYGVAHNVALKAKAMIHKRRTKEKEAGTMSKPEVAEELWQQAQALLDAELSRLPDKYRVPIVLCELEGKTIKDAARQLEWPQGTVATRLARGRTLLSKRLAARGLELSGAVLVAVLSQGGASASVPASLVSSTVKAASLFAAGKAASATVAALAEGVVKTMLWNKIKMVGGILCLVGALAWGIFGALRTEAQPAASPKIQNPPQPSHASDKPKDDQTLLQGTWKVVRADANGKHLPREVSDKQLVVITGDKLTIHYEDGETWAMSYRLFPSEKPKGIDLVARNGLNEGVLMKGIYELAGNGLKLCFTKNQLAAERPKEFDIGEDRGRRVYILERKGPKQAQEGKDPPKTLKLEEPVWRMRWSGDGNLMASYSGREKEANGKKVALCTFCIWDAQTGKQKLSLGEIENPGVMWFDLSPDGKTLAISIRKRIEVGDFIELYDTEKGGLKHTIEMEYARSRVWFAFSPDSGTIAVCGCDIKEGKLQGTVRLFDTGTRKLKQKLVSAEIAEVISVAFSPDGKLLAAGGYRGEVAIWDMATGKVIKVLQAAPSVAALAVSQDGKQVVTGSGGEQTDVVAWEPATGKSQELKGSRDARTQNLAYSPDGKFVAGDGWIDKEGQRKWGVRVWDASSRELLHEWVGSRGFAFTADSKRLAVVEDEKTVKVRELGGKADSKEEAPKKEKGEIAPADRGDRIILWKNVADEPYLAAVNLRDKKVTRLIENPDEAMPSFPVALSPDGRSAVYTKAEINGDHASFKLFVRALDDPKKVGHGLEADGYCSCWSPDGRQMVVVDKDGGYQHYLIDVKTREKKAIALPQVEAVKDATGPVGHVITDWSRDGQWFLAMCLNGAEGRGNHLYRIKTDGSKVERIGGVEAGQWGRFSPDGKSILYTGPDEKGRTRLFVIDAAGGKPTIVSPELNGSIDESGGFCWSPDGKRVAYLWSNFDDHKPGQEYETFLMVIDVDGRNHMMVLSEKSTLVMPIRYPLWQ